MLLNGARLLPPALLLHCATSTDVARPARSGGALALVLEVLLLTPAMRKQGLAPHSLSLSRATDLYWTPAQLLTH